MFRYSREANGYDGIREGSGRYRVYWWFEAWGSGSQAEWIKRDDVGRPPTPEELATADYIVFGFKKGRQVFYKTRSQGLDIQKKGTHRRGRRKANTRTFGQRDS
jgi:hypothetical protein